MAAMTTEQVLGRMRRLLGQVDIATSAYEDQELLEAAEDTRRTLVSRGWVAPDGYAIVTSEEGAGYGITPDPVDPLGEILAIGGAAQLLGQLYRQRLDSGELGISWQSGLEQESTISAGKAYREAIADLERQFGALVSIARYTTGGFRAT